MAKVLLSFLGTNNYLQCNYCFNNKTIERVHYVQEAIVKLFCNDWCSKDSIVVFVTKEAYEKNWIQGVSYEGQTIQGLQKVLENFSNDKGINIKKIDIPDAKNEEEIWSIFDAVINAVNDEDEIIVDVTHAFRAIPMLAVVMINYLQMIKNVRFIGLYYGAIESLGRLQDIAQKDISERNAPIIDLSSFIYLLQFTNNVHNFIAHGDAKGLSTVALESVKLKLKETKGMDEVARTIRNSAKLLQEMTQNFAYCRGKDIINFDYASLYNNVHKMSDVLDNAEIKLKPFKPLVSNIRSKLESFKEYDNVINAKKGIAAAQWCLQHNLIQQSITILQESIITLYA